MRTVIGLTLIAIPFIGVITLGAFHLGWEVLIPLSVSALIFACIYGGVALLVK